jgi:multisubunit Na+/H+ antiporter MnhB subunit
MREHHEFDWQRFWVQEVVILGASMLITVMTSRQDPRLSRPRLVVLLIVVLAMTVLNVLLTKFGKATVDRG